MIDWNKIDTVFLDMDGTLLDLHFDNYFWLEHLPLRYAEIKGLSEQESNIRLQAMYQQHAGSLNWYCLDFWQDSLDIDIVALKQEVAEKIAYRPSAKRFLHELRQHGLDVALVTNAHRKSIELKLQQTDLGEMIDEIICSHDFCLPKENVEFWHALKRERHYDPERTAFFDDNEAVLRSAKTSGIRHLYSIACPDSQKPVRASGEFPLVDDFLHVAPDVPKI